MKIIVFGALGNVGSKVVEEALSRGHDVTAVVRKEQQLFELPKTVHAVRGDAQNTEQVSALIKDHDLVISAVRPAQGQEQLLVPITQAILQGAEVNKVRSLIVGGAASLNLPGQTHTVLSAPNFLPDAVKPIAAACFAQHQAVIASDNSQWAYLSPPAMLVDGVRTGKYRIAQDELIYDAGGNSQISMADFAIVLLDEAEQPRHHQQRFTAAY